MLAIINGSPADFEKLSNAIDTCSDTVDGYNGTTEKMAAVMLTLVLALELAAARISAKPTDTVASAMEQYGISLTDSSGKMYSLRELMEQLRQKLGGLSEAEQAQAAASLFGKVILHDSRHFFSRAIVAVYCI